MLIKIFFKLIKALLRFKIHWRRKINCSINIYNTCYHHSNDLENKIYMLIVFYFFKLMRSRRWIGIWWLYVITIQFYFWNRIQSELKLLLMTTATTIFLFKWANTSFVSCFHESLWWETFILLDRFRSRVKNKFVFLAFLVLDASIKVAPKCCNKLVICRVGDERTHASENVLYD